MVAEEGNQDKAGAVRKPSRAPAASEREEDFTKTNETRWEFVGVARRREMDTQSVVLVPCDLRNLLKFDCARNSQLHLSLFSVTRRSRIV
jgi:hypothetical protein